MEFDVDLVQDLLGTLEVGRVVSNNEIEYINEELYKKDGYVSKCTIAILEYKGSYYKAELNSLKVEKLEGCLNGYLKYCVEILKLGNNCSVLLKMKNWGSGFYPVSFVIKSKEWGNNVMKDRVININGAYKNLKGFKECNDRLVKAGINYKDGLLYFKREGTKYKLKRLLLDGTVVDYGTLGKEDKEFSLLMSDAWLNYQIMKNSAKGRELFKELGKSSITDRVKFILSFCKFDIITFPNSEVNRLHGLNCFVVFTEQDFGMFLGRSCYKNIKEHF